MLRGAGPGREVQWCHSEVSDECGGGLSVAHMERAVADVVHAGSFGGHAGCQLVAVAEGVDQASVDEGLDCRAELSVGRSLHE